MMNKDQARNPRSWYPTFAFALLHRSRPLGSSGLLSAAGTRKSSKRPCLLALRKVAWKAKVTHSEAVIFAKQADYRSDPNLAQT